MKPRNIPQAKPLFLERMQKILLEKQDYQNYLNILKIPPVKSIRCNTLKISVEKLKNKLELKNWKISQPWKDYPEIMIVEGKNCAISPEAFGNRCSEIGGSLKMIVEGKNCAISPEAFGNRCSEIGGSLKETSRCLLPGEIGRSLEHLLGYYYIQELASMLPPIALNPKPNQRILDLCSSPGSKTTQIAAKMENTGTIIANEISLGRIKILASNLERCGVTNTIITKQDGVVLCNRFKKQKIQFDKILIDAPCSGEGTLRSSLKTYLMWNINTIRKLSRIQKNMLISAIEILNLNGEIIYSTCTHAPEENEEVIDFILEKFKDKIKIEKIKLPIVPRQGITKFQDKEYNEKVEDSCRIYPQDNNTEGFFLVKIRRVK